MGTKSLTFKDPDDRRAWQPNDFNTWYLDPSMNHYCLTRFRDPATGSDTDGRRHLPPLPSILPYTNHLRG